ncbi:L-asparaginase precursor [Cordyceps militaris CM01]|uniref:L-asparaginase n=1 Tax=Cordyceps militaris (strain CM01) TaxID=983644 RepID=G3JCI6_CORMM|nr:L-asparaginase precursor [Cordyceps militaris CM01]EGX94647.1 L-asparaginase precursor [Cordyceps militaris CM01]
MHSDKPSSGGTVTPRLVIHGGAGNIVRHGFPVDKYEQYRTSLLKIVTRTHAYMTTPICDAKNAAAHGSPSMSGPRLPSALAVATHAVVQLEDDPLFNSGRGAVFTRDGINQLEASVMVSRGFRKRGVGVMGLRHVRNPVRLARAMLEHGEQDLGGRGADELEPSLSSLPSLDVPSAQGHTQIYGEAAEQLARAYGCAMVEPTYFFTKQRWDEHVRALEKERQGRSAGGTWAADEYLPQGTCGAVAMDEHGVVCAATSTGGMTNKLTGRVGDTPVPGAGFWAEEWTESGDPTAIPTRTPWERLVRSARAPIELTGSLRGFLADCLPTPFLYTPVASHGAALTTTRCLAASGTGNGDSFLRVNAVRTVAAMAQWKPEAAADALRAVVGPGGTLQQSAGDRWGVTGEGEGGMIGIEGVVTRDAQGEVVATRGEILMSYNCGGMYRAWIDDAGRPVMSIWSNTTHDEMPDSDHFE